ncbi:MAG: Uma2 family endonuclease [Candidatus Contendobacter sp.]|nr:Uma2 family endonuclease [Candidatus Contendobacter sp.]MDG4556181.1 Uma2 family endonuclease [Candidatus Contendobacter sp.]
MTATAGKFATYEDLFDLPDNVVGEIIHGQLITHPRPAPKHAVASSAIGDELISPFHKGRGGPGGWWILFEPELHLGPHILVPELAGWRRERMPDMPDIAYFTLPPDWVCEVLSPGTARGDRADKMPIYAAREIPFLWLVDPVLRTLEVFMLHEGHWLLECVYKEDEQVSAAPFNAISFPLADLWC